jgi:UPF0755 protein
MTDYGRGPGVDPWHPEDPLYGDPGWNGQQAPVDHDPYPPGPQDPYGQGSYPPGGQDPYQGQYGQGPYPQGQYGQGQYGQGVAQDPYQGDYAGVHPPGPAEAYRAGYGPDPRAGRSYPQAYPQQQSASGPDTGPYADYGRPYPSDGWDGGNPGGDPRGAQHPYERPGQPAADGYAGGPGGYGRPDGYAGGYAPSDPYAGQDPYTSPEGYAPQGGPYGQPQYGQPPYGQQYGEQQYPQQYAQQPAQAQPGPQGFGQPPGPGHQDPEMPAGDWDHPFFRDAEPHPGTGPRPGSESDIDVGGDAGGAGAPDDRDGGWDGDDRDGGPDAEGSWEEHGEPADDGDADDARRGRDGRSRQQGRRSGLAVVVSLAVLAGVVGGGGYFGYRFWQEHFGSPPDYAGDGSGQVQVDVPQGVSGMEIGDILQRAGVVKSSAAFVAAVNGTDQAIQPGTYTLRKEMSAHDAVRLMTDPSSQNALIVSEGMRDSQVYAAIDKRIGLRPGTTAAIAQKEAKTLGLPAWADDSLKIKDPLEGFLYPSRYSVGKGAKPATVLRQMIAEAKQHYGRYDLTGKAAELGLKSPLQVVTVASLVQAEGKTTDDFRKMADVVYNRLKPGNDQTNGKLEFDSTYNYIKNQSKIDISSAEVKNLDNPYNTYYYAGLPPGPIGNPGDDALQAAMDPDHGGWYYFISLDCKTTKFTRTYAEHQKLVQQFNNEQKKCS